MHVGDFQWGRIISEEAKESQVYAAVMQKSTVYGALEAIREASKQELQSIRTFVVEDRMPLIDPSPESEAHLLKLLKGEEAPQREMRAVFLAGKIKQIYKEQGLKAPPIIMGTVISENRQRDFPHISGVFEYGGDDNNLAVGISRMSAAIAPKSRA